MIQKNSGTLRISTQMPTIFHCREWFSTAISELRRYGNVRHGSNGNSLNHSLPEKSHIEALCTCDFTSHKCHKVLTKKTFIASISAKMFDSNFLSSASSTHVSNSVNSGCHTSITREAGIASTGTIRLANPSALDGRKGARRPNSS